MLLKALFAVSLAWLAFSGAWAQQLTPADVAVAQLPEEARETLAKIKSGGPFAHRQDGAQFGNRERMLPLRERGYYREYTVPTPGARDRGARRIIAGGGGSERTYWYTDDHYNSFRRIRE